MKRCPKCGQDKDYSCFYRSNLTKDGYKCYCKACDKAYKQQNVDKINQYHREYAKNNSSAIQRNKNKWKAKHAEKRRAVAREWYYRNRDKARVNRLKRRARLAGATGKYTAAEWKALCAAHGHKCARCGVIAPLTVDHIVPLSAGGSNDITNIQPLCDTCNKQKGTRAADYRTGMAYQQERMPL